MKSSFRTEPILTQKICQAVIEKDEKVIKTIKRNIKKTGKRTDKVARVELVTRIMDTCNK